MKNGMKLAALLAAFVALVLFAVPLLRGSEPTRDTSVPYGTYLIGHETIKAMRDASNEIRRQAGLKPHSLNEKLTLAAMDHANYMAATRTMDHYNNGGYQGRAVRHGFKGFVMENIAYGQDSVSHVYSTWKNSGGHYAAIVSNTTEAGFGMQVASNGTIYWCMVVGTEQQNKEVK